MHEHGSLSERRGRHVTHLFFRVALHPHHLSGGSRNPPRSFKSPTLLTQDVYWIDGETRRCVHRLLASGGPPASRELTSDVLPSSSIEKHYVLPPVRCAGHS